MATIQKNSQFSFRTDADLLQRAKEIVGYENLDMTTLFNNLLQTVVEQERVPAMLLDNEKSKKDRIVDDLFSEIQKGYTSYLDGKGKSVDEVFSKYGS
ncbi:addiction module antitoxin RelB [Streptococcus hillyeri]|uniref:type II toxin-antitoxin system RelB/ParD family antitoxin n=1 Tax=Streptococcus hillyeri TaxID=2282420 RepID=UPI0034E2F8EB